MRRPQVSAAEGAAFAGRQANGQLYLLCRAGKLLCALPLEHLVETMRALPVEPLPGTPAFVAGVAIVRGAALPVVDMGAVLGGSLLDTSRFVIARTRERLLAIAVEEIVGVKVLGRDRFAELPPLLANASREAVAGIGALDGDLLVFLEAARLLSDEAFAAVDGHIASTP